MNKALTPDRSILLKSLRFRSWHRGCKETDLILGRFADEHLAGLDESGIQAFAALLEEDDADIWSWLTGKSAPAAAAYLPLLERMKLHP